MKDQFRIQRYELQLFYIRHFSVFLIMYAIALVAYVHKLMGDRLWLMILGIAGALILARIVAWVFTGMFMSKSGKGGHEIVFLPLGLIVFICYMVAGMLDLQETSWVEMIILIAFIAMNIYAIYLKHYVKFVRVNRDADYMAVYHVTLGNLRAYRLWYLATALLVLSIAILPMWKSLNKLWSRIIKSLSERFNLAQLNSPNIPATEPGSPVTPTPEIIGGDGFTVPTDSGGLSETAVNIIYILIGAFLLFATYQMVRVLMTKITDAKTSMETDHVIDLKKTLIPIQDEVIRVRDDDVIDENAYARKIRRTFKRTVFDKFGDVDIPEKTPEELLGTGMPQENDDILLEKYEKARYSNIPCTPEDVKAVKPAK